MNHQELLDIAIQKKQDDREPRNTRKFYPSSFGRCYRLQIWSRAGVEISDPPDIKGLKRMRQGVYTHKLLQDDLPSDMVEVKIETEDVSGRADIVESDAVVDIKGCEDYQFKFKNKPTPVFIRDNEMAFLQCGWYALMLNKKYIKVRCNVYGVIDKFRIHIDETENWRQKVQSELDTLREYWVEYLKSGASPPPEPRAFNGNDCTYCPFKTICREGEDESNSRHREQPLENIEIG